MSVQHELISCRDAWYQVLQSDVDLNGQPMPVGDGAAVTDETSRTIKATKHAEIMLFDLV